MAKGGLPGIGNLSVVFAVMAFGGKPAVGILLPVLIAADIVSVSIYKRHASWATVFRLIPWTFIGLGVGYLLMDRLSSEQVRVGIGILVLSLAIIFGLKKYLMSPEQLDHIFQRSIFRWISGLLVGVSTLLANAAGPIAQLYFLSIKLPPLPFAATTACFFIIINLIKVPLFVSLGLFTQTGLQTSLLLAPIAMGGVWIGKYLFLRLNRSVFETLVWIFVVVAGCKLVWF
jgi:uncharacterized membrane protein YfcA